MLVYLRFFAVDCRLPP
ncbi:unnamed protein product, partial [Adineta steineri]